MPLPVLSGSSAATSADLVRLFHQSELDWCRHLGDETTLDAGTRISNPSLAAVAEANCFADARLLPGVSPADLIDEVGACRQWTINPSAPPEQTAPLAKCLIDAGWSRSTDEILILRKQRSRDTLIPDLTVIPARASFGQYRSLMQQMRTTEQAVEAEMLHLDDSHFDAMLAIKDRQPIASIGVLAAGEIGTIRQWFVAPDHRRQGVGQHMLNRVLDLCGRAGFRHVMAGVPADSSALPILNSNGFEKVGERVIFSIV